MLDSVRLVPLDRFNWERVLDIRLQPVQEAFVPSILYSLAQAKFENLFPYGIEWEGQMVGFLMYGEFQGICWISRIIIDKEYQSRYIGSSALTLLLQQLKTKPSCKEVRTSFDSANEAARFFFERHLFAPINPDVEGEWVAVWQGK